MKKIHQLINRFPQPAYFRNYYFSLMLLLTGHSVFSQNLITNGDFESGGAGVGFTSNYNLTTGPTVQQTYAIVSNPSTINPSFSNTCVDHTTGNGKMMVADGANGSQNKIWEQVPGGGLQVLSGRTYIFSYWIQSVSTTNAVGNLPDIEVRYNNTVLSPTTGSTVCPATLCQWTQVIYTFTSTSNYAQIWLFDKTTVATGNDFALDDLSLTIVPLPLSIRAAAGNISCPDNNDGFIAVTGSGGTPPYAYSLNGGPFVSNNGLFTGLSASTGNTVAVRDAASPTPATVNGTTTLDIIAPTNPLSVNNDTAICTGSSVNLLATGGITYSWLPVTGLDFSNIPNPVATPAVTTTYTVTSDVISNNLLANPEFENGNGGFTTDYDFYTNTTNQNAWGITDNAQSFDINFSPCIDHSGIGKMMVIDGSTINNSRVWCQTIPVNPSTTYTFSYWIQTIALPSPAQVETWINGVPITGSSVTSTATAPATVCQWIKVTYTWNSGVNTTAVICLYDRNTIATGNDFAVDDISFTTVCTLSKSVTINVSSTAPSATPTQPTCTTATGSITVTSPASGVTYSFDNGVTYQAEATKSGLTPATYQVVVKTIGGCVSSATAVTIDPVSSAPAAPSATPTQPTCTTATGSITVTVPASGVTYSFDNGVTYQAEATKSGLTPATYQVVVKTTGGCVSSATAVTIDPVPSAPAAPTATPIQPTCTTATGSITVTVPASGVTYSFDNGVTYQAAATISGLTPATYQVVVKTDAGCISAATAVTIDPVPGAPATPTATPTQPTCTTATGAITVASSTSGVTYSFDNGVTYQAEATRSGLTPATYQVVVKTGSGCISAATTVTINEQPATPKVDAGIDETVTAGTTVTLTGKTDVEGTYSWTASTGTVADPAKLVTTAKPVTNTTYTLVVTTSSQCVGSDSKLVFVESTDCVLDVPKAFTPNGDGTHDYWKVFDNQDCYLQVKVDVFNRWGSRVYHSDNYDNKWEGKWVSDGTGRLLPDGTYYYVIIASLRNGRQQRLTGNVTIIR